MEKVDKCIYMYMYTCTCTCIHVFVNVHNVYPVGVKKVMRTVQKVSRLHDDS